MISSAQPVETNDDVEYSPETDTYRASFDTDAESASLAVVSTVAAVSGTHPTDLTPLNATVDPDALEAVTQSTGSGATPGDVVVSFTFDGYAVTVCAFGLVEVRPQEDGIRCS